MEPILPAPTITMSFIGSPWPFDPPFFTDRLANGRVVLDVSKVQGRHYEGHNRQIAMDVINKKLLLALQENGRASTAELARLVGRSRTSVQSRIDRLEKQRVILGYAVL